MKRRYGGVIESGRGCHSGGVTDLETGRGGTELEIECCSGGSMLTLLEYSEYKIAIYIYLSYRDLKQKVKRKK